MMYQLPNGQVIHLSIEEYLSVSDEELNSLANCGYGEDPSYAFHYGPQKKENKKEVTEEMPLDIPKEDLGIDFNSIDLDSIGD